VMNNLLLHPSYAIDEKWDLKGRIPKPGTHSCWKPVLLAGTRSRTFFAASASRRCCFAFQASKAVLRTRSTDRRRCSRTTISSIGTLDRSRAPAMEDHCTT
jgi:hypothetical protein